MKSIQSLICVEDFHKQAQATLPLPNYEFIEDASETGATLSRNLKAFSLYKLKQRVLMGKIA